MKNLVMLTVLFAIFAIACEGYYDAELEETMKGESEDVNKNGSELIAEFKLPNGFYAKYHKTASGGLFIENIAKVNFDCISTDHQLIGDFLIAGASGNQA